ECRAHDNGRFGFEDLAVPVVTHHLYLENVACDNALGNYNANLFANNDAIIRGPNNARGVQNVDCSITTTDEIPIILSKVCQIQQSLATCCFTIENLIFPNCCTE